MGFIDRIRERIGGLGKSDKDLTLKDVTKEIERKKRELRVLDHNNLLSSFESSIQPIDFLQKAGLDGTNQKLKQKHYIVIVIEEIIRIAQENDWGLCMYHGRAFCYNGEYWIEISTDKLKQFISGASERMGLDKFDARFYEYKDKLLKQFIDTAVLPPPVPDDHEVLINLDNGTFSITRAEQKLRHFKKEDFLTYQLPFSFNKDAEAPLFRDYLDKVLPDESLQEILAEFIGYVFVKDLKLEKALLLYGSGANGKSVFFDIITALLGRENVSNFSLQGLTDERGYSRAAFEHKLLNYSSEITGRLRTSIFKQLVSGEPTEARLPYGKPYSIANYGKLVFNCNQLPRDTELTHAFFRRFLIIPFEVQILESEQDKNLSSKIIEKELPGVFNWVLSGLNRVLRHQTFSNSKRMHNLLEEFKSESDSVLSFIEDNNLVSSVHHESSLKRIYLGYNNYCIESGNNPLGKSRFKRRLLENGISVKRKKQGYMVALEKDVQ